MLKAQHEKILRLTHRLKHPTTSHIHHFLFPHQTRRTVQIHLHSLIEKRMLAYRLLYPEHGNRSERYYYLLQRGAQAIGYSHVQGNHYRTERREYHLQRNIKLELINFTYHYDGYYLFESERDMQSCLLSFLRTKGSEGKHERVQIRDAREYIPLKLRPDRVLKTPHGSYLCIIAHPLSGKAFWKARVKQYHMLSHHIPILCFPLTQSQQQGCQESIAATKNFHLITPNGLPELFVKLSFEIPSRAKR